MNPLLLILLFLYTCNGAGPICDLCNSNSNTVNTNISSNIGSLLAELVSKTPSPGYISTSIGQGQDKVFGLAQCRGDVSTKDCSGCVQDAAKQIRQRCPNQVDARIWYDFCFLRYNTENFIGKLDTYTYSFVYVNIENYTFDPKVFNKKLGSLMDKIRSEAVVPKNNGIGKGETKLSSFITLYGLVQCTRDLKRVDCAQCLAIAIGNFPTVCDNRKGCTAIYSNCYVRYELYPFFFPLNSTNSISSSSANTYVVVVNP